MHCYAVQQHLSYSLSMATSISCRVAAKMALVAKSSRAWGNTCRVCIVSTDVEGFVVALGALTWTSLVRVLVVSVWPL